MAQKPNNLPLIIIAVVAVGGIVGLNMMNQKNDPAIQEKIDKEAEKAAEKKQADADIASGKTPPAPTPMPQPPGANDVVGWGADKTFGTPGGKPSITFGWTWTPAVQGDPSSVYTAVNAVKGGFPKAAIRVVNLDVTPGAVAPGISVDGAVRVQLMPDGKFPPVSQFMATMMRPGVAPVPSK